MKIVKRLQGARLSLMKKQPFYALLLMHMKFALDLTCDTAYTDGSRIAFNPDFINDLDDSELEFVLMHEVLHAALAHPFRYQADYETDKFDIACDIIVNSNILYSFGMDTSKITLKKYGELMHLMPNGEEGYKYSIEDAYRILMDIKATTKKDDKKKNKSNDPNGKGSEGSDSEGEGEGKSKGGKGKGDEGEGKGGDGEGEGGDGEVKSGSVQGSGKGGGKMSLEELIASIKAKNEAIAQALKKEDELKDNTSNDTPKSFDDHSFWEGDDDNGTGHDTWMQRLVDATDIISAMDQGSNSCGNVPLAVERIVEELKNPLLDWKVILNDFVQEEICDYSFSPPDKRMEDSPFFLPDFNEKDETAKNLLFMIDTSGSMSNHAITECYSEIYGAIQQFDGKLTGKLGFFDAVVVEPIPFESEDEFKIIRPKGGGGTSFQIIFDYVREKMQDEPPVSIIILTDGFAPFPEESEAIDIPVLWIINNKEATPPWGKIARLLSDENKG